MYIVHTPLSLNKNNKILLENAKFTGYLCGRKTPEFSFLFCFSSGSITFLFPFAP